MKLSNPFARRLSLRIWLTVVVGMAVLTLAVGWAWRVAVEENSLNQPTAPGREMVLRGPDGQAVVRGYALREPGPPGEGINFRIQTDTGEKYTMELGPKPPREDRREERRGERRAHGMQPPGSPPGGGPDRTVAFWLRPPFGFVWMLGIMGVAVALGVYPVIRRLTLRLEALQRSVKKFGDGDLSVRVPDTGQDEVADLARQFNASAERIETLVKSHKSLLANASHELRSPLTRIRMGLELMGGQTPSPTFRAEILRNIAELDQLVDEILLASRLEQPDVDVGSSEAVDLIGLAAEECARVDADLQLHTTALEVPGIARLLRRAVRNLLENAKRYSQGSISLELLREGEQAIVRVQDHGPGVPPEQRERIFEKFYRLPGASERSGGVGLGLALVRSIAQRHGGSVRCLGRSDGAPGACFELRLPMGE